MCEDFRRSQRIRETFEKEDIDWQKRVIPQVYAPDEIEKAKSLGYQNIIFTLYRFGNNKEAVKDAITKNKVWAVTLWASWWDSEWKELIEKAGSKALVHTVNDVSFAENLFKLGVNGIYTDHLPLNR